MTTVIVEGQTFSGKSTLVSRLGRFYGSAVVPEYAELGPLPTIPFVSEQLARASVDALLSREAERKDEADRAACDITIVDRSILSVLACHHAHEALGFPSAWRYLIDQIHAAAEAERILVPDAMVYLRVSLDVARSRELKRGHMVDFLMQDDVRIAMDDFYSRALPRSCSRVLHRAGTDDPDLLTEDAVRFIDGASGMLGTLAMSDLLNRITDDGRIRDPWV